jgi:lipoprotein NlpI
MSSFIRQASLLLITCAAIHAQSAEELVKSAIASAREGNLTNAVELASKAITQNPAEPQTWYYRGLWNEQLDRKDAALSDFNKVLALQPKSAQTLQRRGAVHFQLGRIEESLADFDKFLELQPGMKPQHWQRGITLYYLDKFEEGQRQFELHQSVNPDDVENAVWHYLCLARKEGVEKARERLIPIRRDSRVPMMELYDLYKGTGSEEKVWQAVRAGDPSAEDLKERSFYAHLYLGLYDEARGQREASLKHIEKAVNEFPSAHYMGDVARVHLKLRQKK